MGRGGRKRQGEHVQAELTPRKRRKLREARRLADGETSALADDSSPLHVKAKPQRASRQKAAIIRATTASAMTLSSDHQPPCCWLSPMPETMQELDITLRTKLPIQFLSPGMRQSCRDDITVEMHEDIENQLKSYDILVETSAITVPPSACTFYSSKHDCLFEAVLMAIGAKRHKKNLQHLREEAAKNFEENLLNVAFEDHSQESIKQALLVPRSPAGVTVAHAVSAAIGRPLYIYDSRLRVWLYIQCMTRPDTDPPYPAIYLVLAGGHIRLMYRWDPAATVAPSGRTVLSESFANASADDDAAPLAAASANNSRLNGSSASSDSSDDGLDAVQMQTLLFPPLVQIYTAAQKDKQRFSVDMQEECERSIATSSLISTHPFDTLRLRLQALVPDMPEHLRGELTLISDVLFHALGGMAVRMNMVIRQVEKYTREHRDNARRLRDDLDTVAPVPAVCTKPTGSARWVQIIGQKRYNVTELARSFSPLPGASLKQLICSLSRHIARRLIKPDELRFYTWSHRALKMIPISFDISEKIFETLFDCLKIDLLNPNHFGRDATVRKKTNTSLRSLFNEARDTYKSENPEMNDAEINRQLTEFRNRIQQTQLEKEGRQVVAV